MQAFAPFAVFAPRARAFLAAFGLGFAIGLPGGPASAEEAVDLDTVEVRGRGADLIGVADSASQG